MATSQAWYEYNGSAGTVTETLATYCNWKATVDDYGTDYRTLPIAATQSSMWKIQALKFTNASGATAYLSALSYFINTPTVYSSTAATPYWKIAALVPSSGTFFSQPLGGTTVLPTIAGSAPVSMPIAAGTLTGTWGTGSGATTAFTTGASTAGPFTNTVASTTTMATATILYTTALYTQLQTGTLASPGTIGGFQVTATWTES